MATSTKFLGTARLSSRHVPEAATTEHVGEQVAGVAEQALLGLWHLPRVDAGDTCTHHRHASISLLVAILPQKSLTNSVARHAGNYSLLNGTSCETTILILITKKLSIKIIKILLYYYQIYYHIIMIKS
jgi:hypothetical protein